MPEIALNASLVIALFVWVVIALFALWRNNRLTHEIENLQSRSDFFDRLLYSDYRHPIWVWPSGRIQASREAMALLNLPSNIDDITDLTGDGSYGLTKDALDAILSNAAGVKAAQQPLTIRYSHDSRPILIDTQYLDLRKQEWPYCILWVEEMASAHSGAASSGLRGLQTRLNEVTNILDRMPFPVWVRDEKDNIIDVNKAYVAAVEADDDQAVLRKKTELFNIDVQAAARKVRDTNTESNLRRSAVVGGKVLKFLVRQLPLPNGHILGLAIDISAEEEAQKELSRVQKAQSETLNLLRTPVAIFGPNQSLRYFNSAFSRLTQVSEEILASNIYHGELLDIMRDKRRIPEQADYGQWRKNQLKLYTSVLKEPDEDLWHLPDGSAHRVVAQPHPQSGLLILFEDITDRLTLEQQYNTLIAVQQETLDNMREGVAVFSTSLQLKLANPAFAAMWDLNANQLTEEPHLTDLIPNIPVRSQTVSKESQTFKDMLPAWMSERETREGRWEDINKQVIDYALVPLPDGGMMLTQVDVTDSYRVQEALAERGRALEVASRLKDQFITSMSYELRTPLNSIIGFSELLKQQLFGPLNDAQSNYLDDILSSAEELKDLISDVLDLAFIEADESKLDSQKVDLSEILTESTTLARELALKANTRLTLNTTQGSYLVMGDPRRLKQAFYNMVSAMLSFSQKSGRLELSLECGGSVCLVKITNEDCGLSTNDRTNLLASVNMGGMPHSRRATGIDLALVRGIVKKHGGHVSIEPYERDGIMMLCTIPHNNPETGPSSEQLTTPNVSSKTQADENAGVTVS